MSITRREALTRLWSAAALLIVACKPDARPTVRQGLVVEMQAASFVRIASLTLRTDDGELIEMTCEGDVGMTPGHLRDHMALADPVAVTVKYDGSRVIALRVDDVSAPAVPTQAAPAAQPPRQDAPVSAP